MPELPEVETIVRGLRGPLINCTFTGVTFSWPRTLQTSSTEIRQKLPGQQISSLSRRGKYIVFHLKDGYHLLIHLKMSGNLFVLHRSEPRTRHEHTIFSLDNDYQLRFRDVRKFGRVYFVRDLETVLGRLGPEPLDGQFTDKDFRQLFRGRHGRLKPLLLNQEFIAGIGNIYADESCFLAKIHPIRAVDTLSPRELSRLFQAIREALHNGIMYKGASLDQVYRGGEFQHHFTVYGRKGKACPRCSATIQRIVVAARSTHFCPKCQKKKRTISS